MSSILIIEDETELVRVLRSYLERAGFTVISAFRGDDGFFTWQQKKPDLVILDLNLPGMDGLDIARNIRRQDNTPIIMLTARIEETDELIGLEIGADDYILKPFSPRVVVARVRSLLRRHSANLPASQIIRASDLEIDPFEHTVRRGEDSIALTPTEFNILMVMAEQPGRVFSRLQLLETSQGVAYEGYERTIDAHIKNLRSKLEPNKRIPKYIETVFGIGYRFIKSD